MKRDRELRKSSVKSSVLLFVLSLFVAVSPAAGQDFKGSLDRSFGGNGPRGISSVGFGQFDQTNDWVETA